MTEPKLLNAKQLRFVDEYLIDLNATQAYLRVYGGTEKAARAHGARLVANGSIAAAIKVAQRVRAERTQITQDRVLEELARIGFSDMRRFAVWGGAGVTLRASDDLGDDEARCVAGVSESPGKFGSTITFKLHDKPAALLAIGKHLGMFTEQHEHRFPDLPNVERVDRLGAILSAARHRAANGNGKR